jgi:septal ring factor EnvC (AmiA/AmiB activator)
MLRSTSSSLHRFSALRSLALGSVLLGVCPGLTTAEDSPNPVADARETYKEYIEIRKVLGDEITEWTTQKQTLQDMVDVMEAESAELDEKMAALTASATSADQKRAELNTKLEAGRTTSKAFDATLVDLESRVTALAVALPGPLARELAPLLARLPEDPSKSRLSYSQRLQSVIGILAQTDKFNTDVKYVSEVQDVGGDTREVQTLYLGLAAALFTDSAGDYAGYGTPSATGWTWKTVQGEQALAIAHAVDVYLSRKSPEFVTIPLLTD